MVEKFISYFNLLLFFLIIFSYNFEFFQEVVVPLLKRNELRTYFGLEGLLDLRVVFVLPAP